MEIPKKGELFANLSVFFLSLVVCLLLIDAYVRFFMPEKSILVNYDDKYVFKLVPGSTTIGSDPDIPDSPAYTVRINSLGFKDYEFPVEKTSKRIMVYGDSFIMGSPDLGHTFPKQLQSQLEKRLGEGVQVINAGVIGYAPDQISARMDDELPVYKPDMVVVAIFAGNDFGDNVRHRMYRLDGNSLVKNNFTISPQRRLIRDIAGIFPSTQLYYQLYLGLGSANNSLSSSLKSSIATNIKDCEDLYLYNKTETVSPFNEPLDMDMVAYPESDCTSFKKRLMAGILGKIKDTARSNGVPLMVMVIPPIYEVDDDSYSSFSDAMGGVFNRSYMSGTASAIAQSQGLTFLNLYPYFVEENRNAPVYLPEGHWNVHGQSYAAQVAADKIIGEGLLGNGEK